MEIKEIRYINARALASRYAKQRDFADAIDRSPAQASAIIGDHDRRKKIGDDLARHIEMSLNLPVGWMDTLHDNDDSVAATNEKPGQVTKYDLVMKFGAAVERIREEDAEDIFDYIDFVLRKRGHAGK